MALNGCLCYALEQGVNKIIYLDYIVLLFSLLITLLVSIGLYYVLIDNFLYLYIWYTAGFCLKFVSVRLIRGIFGFKARKLIYKNIT